jgi:hypothetical protein
MKRKTRRVAIFVALFFGAFWFALHHFYSSDVSNAARIALSEHPEVIAACGEDVVVSAWYLKGAHFHDSNGVGKALLNYRCAGSRGVILVTVEMEGVADIWTVKQLQISH